MNNIIQSIKIFYLRFIEDIFAILLGTLIISFGILMLKQAGALIGSSAGIAFLISHVTSLTFGSVFSLINLPFYWFSVQRMGWEFTLKTFSAVALVSLFTYLHPLFIHFSALNPVYATFFGNIIMGIGFILLFRHKASLGGINILALWLQKHIGLRAGKLQMIVDICVVLASILIVSSPMIIISILGAVILNLIITMNYNQSDYRI
ncbi:YitT family protein [Pantoea sp. Aalb]|uniref:YitT family protein n=1 Tax=Pantoea sp. Aalb TaxID=2576762 RepID=UPI0013286C82|nr:YitT family protein [Pantoea sp. Aalb]MXP67795.1 YitT family protein [Pantoea sp. Aalb]